MKFALGQFWYNRRKQILRIAGFKYNGSIITEFGSGDTLILNANGKMYVHGTENQYDLITLLPKHADYKYKPQPIIIPWTIDTCPLREIIIGSVDNRKRLLIEANDKGCWAGSDYFSYVEILKLFTKLDGTPCGTISEEVS